MPQGTLDGFFGLKTQPQQKQTKLTGFVKKKQDKENTKNKEEDEDVLPRKREVVVEPDHHRRRLAIMDSDDEEEKEVSESPAKKIRVENNISNSKEQASKKAGIKSSDDKSEEKPKSKVNASLSEEQVSEKASKATADEKPIVSKSNSKLAKQARKLAKAANVDVEVGEIGSPVLYQDLARALEKIEAIKGRLEIQKILTDLLRRILQHCPEDLHSVIYLASNSVAPAYKCIELGIGDGILVKAIGQAYGIRAGMFQNQQSQVMKLCKG